MNRSVLTAATAAIAACLAPLSLANAFEAPTAAAFFDRFVVPEEVSIQLEDDGSVLLSAPAGFNGSVFLSLRPDEVPAPGARSISVNVTIVEDGGGWPDALVGFGLMHGYQTEEPRPDFSVGVISPQDGGTLRLGQYTGSSYAIGQVLGNGGAGVGETVQLSMREIDGSLEFTLKNDNGTSQSNISNDLTSAGMADDFLVGFVMVSGGSYRISDLEISATE